MVKDYGYMFRNDPALADAAKTVTSLARDISEFISEKLQGELGSLCGDVGSEKAVRVVYQSACSLQHGQQIRTQPIQLLQSCGYEVIEPRNPHLCCGSAGTYNILQADLADRLRDEKLESLAETEPQVIASGNVGCMVQLGSKAPCPVVHTVELIDWATGGPKPGAIP